MSDSPQPIREPQPSHIVEEPVEQPDIPPDWDDDPDEDGEGWPPPDTKRLWDGSSEWLIRTGWPSPEDWWP